MLVSNERGIGMKGGGEAVKSNSHWDQPELYSQSHIHTMIIQHKVKKDTVILHAVQTRHTQKLAWITKSDVI